MTGSAWCNGIPGVCRVLVGLALAVLATAPPAGAQDLVVGPFAGLVRLGIFDGLANQVGTLPNPSGGGFTYQFDPGLGIFTRSTESFGPIFTDRAETTGRGKVTLHASYTRYTFDEIDGVKLRTGSVLDIIAGVSPGNIRFNLLEFREDVEANVFTIGALYGVTDRLDVGVTIPIIHAKWRERAKRLAFIDCPPDFGGDLGNCGGIQVTGEDLLRSEAEASGLGDIVLRAKYNVWQWPSVWGGRVGIATSLDVKVPTGDDGDRDTFGRNEIEFVPPTSTRVSDSRFRLGDPPLGTGIVRVKPQLIVSGSWAGFSPHINVGAELGETEGITNDLVYAVGFDWTLAGRATFVADVIGRHAFGVDRLEFSRGAFGVAQITGEKANPDSLTASLGVKFNPVGTLLVFFNVLLPLNNTGVRDTVTPTVGAEWSF